MEVTVVVKMVIVERWKEIVTEILIVNQVNTRIQPIKMDIREFCHKVVNNLYSLFANIIYHIKKL